MIRLSISEIVLMHTKLIDKTGGAHGIRDVGMLESAVYGADGGYIDIDIYPSVEEKAARIAFAIIKNHAFVDGNKRIGILAMLVTLRLNNINMEYYQIELIRLGLSIADGTVKYDHILEWIRKHKI